MLLWYMVRNTLVTSPSHDLHLQLDLDLDLELDTMTLFTYECEGGHEGEQGQTGHSELHDPGPGHCIH